MIAMMFRAGGGLRRVAAGVLLAASFASSAAAEKPLQIVLLGDALTEGEPSQRSFRYYLWRHLVDANLRFDFVGTRHGQVPPASGWPVHRGRLFDPDHEGHEGWRIDHIINGKEEGRGDLTTWLDAYTPDVAVVLLGTHDALEGQPTEWAEREVRRVIETLRRDNERMAILLVAPPPTREAENVLVAELSPAYEALAEQETTELSPIVFVDLYRGFDADLWLLPDGVLPSERGEQYMADRVAAALLDLDPAHLDPLRQTSAQAWGAAVVVPLGAAFGFILLGRSQLRRERVAGTY